MGTTPLSNLPYPEATDQPFVHLDIKALAEAVAERLVVTAPAAPPHLPGRRWHDSSTGRTWVSNGSIWLPADGRPIASSMRVASIVTPASGAETYMTGDTVAFQADGATWFDVEWSGPVSSTVADDRVQVLVRQGASGTSDPLVTQGVFIIGNPAGVEQAMSLTGRFKPAAGSVTLRAYIARGGGGGAARSVASASQPGILSIRPAVGE